MVGAPGVKEQTFIRSNRFEYMKAFTFRLQISIWLIFLISCNQGPGTGSSESIFDSATDEVSLIQREIIRINGITSEIRIFRFPCDEEVDVTYYLDKGKAVKIVIDWPVVNNRHHKEEFYFKDGQLIFEYDYLEEGADCEDCLPVLEKKTYIADGKPIQHQENDSVKNCIDCRYEEDHLGYVLYPARSRQELREILCPDS